MSTDTKPSKAWIFRIIQSAGSFGSWLGNLGVEVITDIEILLVRDNLPG